MYLACACCRDSVEQIEEEPRVGENGDVCTSEGIENGGFEHGSETSTVTANGYYSKNLSNAINGDEKGLKLIPLGGVDKEVGGKDEEVLQGRAKSRTPSPKSSIDEIVAVSEMADLVTEKVEPSGKAYFVEDVNEKESDRSSEETSKAIAILDDILDDEEKNEHTYPSLDDESLASPVFREQSVIADIHREDEISMLVEEIFAEVAANAAQNQPPVEETEEPPPIPPRAAFVVGQDEDAESLNSTEEDVHYNRLDSQKQKQFINRPKLQKSSSEPNFVILLDNSTATNESETDTAEHSPQGSVPPAPKFDQVVYNTLKPDSELVKVTSPIPSRSPVPEAPKFDPVLYSTLGRAKSPRPSLLHSPTINTSGYSEDDPDPSANPREVFKSKLEQLLQRGPTNKPRPRTVAIVDRQVSFPPPVASVTPTQPAPPPSTVTPPQPTEVTSPTANTLRPFDTKRKQKLLFDDVIKAITPETRPSVIRSSLEHRMSFTEFKNGLKKTVPPKQYLPNA
ncbi:hypothetical protein pipiens_008658 [Culex pipiens pipiens]|uniref:Uncharacterized protein n=1 Tax=Culex pipiens pipiens TaxID=38569 RepID=A0ABD1DGT8_CULPP